MNASGAFGDTPVCKIELEALQMEIGWADHPVRLVPTDRPDMRRQRRAGAKRAGRTRTRSRSPSPAATQMFFALCEGTGTGIVGIESRKGKATNARKQILV